LTLAVLPEKPGITHLLLDIEGTTSSVDFVYKTLFPFAAEGVEQFLREHATEAEIVELMGALRREHAADLIKHPALGPWVHGNAEEATASAAKYVQHLIAVDRKLTPLKTLQGMIWEEGFRSGELKGHVYEDVQPAFIRWKHEGKRIAIFSSGSVLAQKLLFGHSIAGDLTVYVDDYFDTTTGPKREAASYGAIAKALRTSPNEVMFFSDVIAELDAAQAAEMKTVLMVRPGAPRPAGTTHVIVESLDDVHLEALRSQTP
jgi:enolase-phosphatase E1